MKFVFKISISTIFILVFKHVHGDNYWAEHRPMLSTGNCPPINLIGSYKFNPTVFSGKWYFVYTSSEMGRELPYCMNIEYTLGPSNLTTKYNFKRRHDSDRYRSHVDHWKVPIGWYMPLLLEHEEGKPYDAWILGTDSKEFMVMHVCHHFNDLKLAMLSSYILSRYESLGDYEFKQALHEFKSQNISTKNFTVYDQAGCGAPKRLPSSNSKNAATSFTTENSFFTIFSILIFLRFCIMK